MKGQPGSTVASRHAAHEDQQEPAAPDDLLFIADHIASYPLPLGRFAGDDGYDGRGSWRATAMARAHIYQRLVTHIESANSLEAHFHHYPEVADRLGLDESPNFRTLNRSWREQFDATTKKNLKGLVKTLRKDLLEATEGVASIVSRTVKTQDGRQIPQEEKDKAYAKVEDRLYDLLDYDRSDNARISAETFTDFASYCSRHRYFPEEGSETWAAEEARDEDELFNPETFRQAIRKKGREWAVTNTAKSRPVTESDPEEFDWSIDPHDDEYGGEENWHSITEEGIEKFVGTLQESGVLTGEVPICIDGSVRPYHRHGSTKADRPEGVHWRGAQKPSYGWEDLSAVAIVDGRAVCLANINYTPDDNLFESVKYLVDRCRDLVDVECFYADAEFGNTDIMRYIDHLGEYYVMKAREHQGVKKVLNNFEGEADWVDEFGLKSTRKSIHYTTSLFAIESDYKSTITPANERGEESEQVSLGDFSTREGQSTLDELEGEQEVDYEAFYTNKNIQSEGIRPSKNPVAHDTRNTVWGMAASYRRRWAIETAFRQVKYQFLARTASRDLGVRRYFWMMSLLLYNSWATMNLLVQQAVPEWTYDRPPVKGNVFLVEISKRLRPPPD